MLLVICMILGTLNRIELTQTSASILQCIGLCPKRIVGFGFDGNVLLEAEGTGVCAPSIISNGRSRLCFSCSLLSFSRTRFCPVFFLPFRKLLFSFHVFCLLFFEFVSFFP